MRDRKARGKQEDWWWITAALICAFIVTAASQPAVAQDPETPPRPHSQAERFRKTTLDNWNWEPNSGVALTTTKYAVDYITNRYLSDHTFPARSIKLEGRRVLVEDLQAGVVLFQTADLDIIVLNSDAVAYYAGRENPVLVVDRQSKRAIFEQLLGGPCEASFTFIDIDAQSPMELRKRRSCTTAGTSGSWSATVHRLDSSFEEIHSIDGAFVASQCPRVQISSGGINSRQGRGVSVKIARSIALKRDDATCHFLNPTKPATLIKQCPWNESSGLTRCKSRVLRAQIVDADSLAPFNSPENAAFLVDNMDELRRKGFEFGPRALKMIEETLAHKNDDDASD